MVSGPREEASPRGAGLRRPEIHVKGFSDGSQDPRSTGWCDHLHGRSRDGIRRRGGLAASSLLPHLVLLNAVLYAVLLDVLRAVVRHVRLDVLHVA